MSKTILGLVDGWTPCIDVLVDDYGIITAAVFGRVWRYCQGERGLCDASLETVAKETRLAYRTILRHVKLMVKDGYLEDLDPGVRYRPHRYRDTGKVHVTINLKAGLSESQIRSVTESHIGMTESQLKKEVKKQRRDSRSDHPAILCIRGLVGKYPPKELYDDAIKILGDSPDGEKLAACRKEWIQRGYNPNAWTWLTEWYQNGTGKTTRRKVESGHTTLEGV